jgi:hypothetical protein
MQACAANADVSAQSRKRRFMARSIVLRHESAWVLGRPIGFHYRLRDHLRWMALAGGALLADVLLKWVLAPSWREMIRSAAGW